MFKKGQVKTGGIQKGQKQGRVLQWEQFGRELLEAGLPRALEVMKTCDDDKFIDNFLKLLEYFKPKLARIEHEGAIQVKTISETTFLQIKPKSQTIKQKPK